MRYRNVEGRDAPDDLRDGRCEHRANRRQRRREAEVPLADERGFKGANVAMIAVVYGGAVMVVKVLDDVPVHLLQAGNGRVHMRQRQHGRCDRCCECTEHDGDAGDGSFQQELPA